MILLNTAINYGANLLITNNKHISATCVAASAAANQIHQIALDAIELLVSIVDSHKTFENNQKEISAACAFAATSAALFAAKYFKNDHIFCHCSTELSLGATRYFMMGMRYCCPGELIEKINNSTQLQWLRDLAHDATAGFLVSMTLSCMAATEAEQLRKAAYSALTSVVARALHIGIIELNKRVVIIVKENTGNSENKIATAYLRIAYVLSDLVPMILVGRLFNVNTKFEGLDTKIYAAMTKDNIFDIKDLREAPFVFYN